MSFLASSFYTNLFFEGFHFGRFFSLNLIMLLYLAAILSMTVMFSTVLRSQILAGVFSLLGWMLMVLGAQLGAAGRFLPGGLMGAAQDVIAGNSLAWQPIAGTMVLIMVFYSTAFLVFRKWEG